MINKFKHLIGENINILKERKTLVAIILIVLALIVGLTITLVVFLGDKDKESGTSQFAEKVEEPATLEITVFEDGEGETASSGAKVSLHYLAKTLEGVELYSTKETGEPFTFTMDSTRAPYAFNRSLESISEGSRLNILVPSKNIKGVELGEVDTETVNYPILLEVEVVEVREARN